MIAGTCILKRFALLALVSAGLMFTGQGLWIHAKAVLAQYLLRDAWAKTLTDGPPHKPWPWAEHWPVARLTVADHGVDQIVLSGDSGNVLAFAPGHNRLSGLPGEHKTIVISGHRDTHFAFLKDLRVGEAIGLQNRNGKARYRISDLQVIDSRNTRIRIDPFGDELLLITCYPFDGLVAGGPMRYVVTAQQSGFVL